MVSAHILVFIIYALKEMGRLLLIHKQLLGGKKSQVLGKQKDMLLKWK